MENMPFCPYISSNLNEIIQYSFTMMKIQLNYKNINKLIFLSPTSGARVKEDGPTYHIFVVKKEKKMVQYISCYLNLYNIAFILDYDFILVT